MNIAVIGSGFGGLAAALLLAHKGHKVTVYEQQATAGGKAQQLQLGKYRFDKGPSLLTMPLVFEDLFKEVGKDWKSYVPYEELDVLCKYWYPDGKKLTAYSNKKKLFNELTAKTTVKRHELESYFKYAQRIYNNAADPFLYNPLIASGVFRANNMKLLFSLGKLDPLRTLRQGIKKHIEDPYLVQFFSRYATYIGSNPYVCPATLNIVPAVEYKYGGHYPKKGIYSMIEGFVKACTEEGVIFNYKTPVQEVVVESNIAVGIKVNNKILKYDKIVSNADVTHLYSNLIKKNTKQRAKYEKLEPSSSALVFFWGVEGNFKDLDSHNIFFSKDYKKEFDQIFTEKVCPDDPTIYISISSKYNPKDAPKNSENWFVMINAPYVDGQDWSKELKIQRKIIKKKLESYLGPIKIKEEATLTPKDIQTLTSSNKGAIYGTSSNDKMAAFLRHQNKSRIKNLYCCGGSTHPGGGMTLSTLSGTFVANMIDGS